MVTTSKSKFESDATEEAPSAGGEAPSGDSVTRESAGSGESAAGSADSLADGGHFESWLRDAAQVESSRRSLLPTTGQVVSEKYRIEEELGKGGMGAVYRATHVVSHKAVALKWMLRSSGDERAKERFTREARAAGRIDHPNVVDVYDIGEEGDGAYLVMELLRGESLGCRLQKGPLDVHEAVDLLLPAMRGVEAAHAQGVLHRDLKPDNIFLCEGPDGTQREAKVLDFGISTITAADDHSHNTLTKEGAVLGTPSYMSPEQLENARDVDARADVYALGVILYECLTGRLPFEAETYSALVLAIAGNKPPSPREHRPDIPAEIEAVILRALDRNRYESVEALMEALAPFASVRHSTAGDLAVAGLPKKGPPRSLIAATLVVFILLAVAGLWSSRNTSTAVEEPALANEASVVEQASEPEPPAEPRVTEADAQAAVGEANEVDAQGGEVEASENETEVPSTVPVGDATPTEALPKPQTAVKPRVTQSVPVKRAPKSPAGTPVVSPESPSAPAPKPGRSGSISPQDL